MPTTRIIRLSARPTARSRGQSICLIISIVAAIPRVQQTTTLDRKWSEDPRPRIFSDSESASHDGTGRHRGSERLVGRERAYATAASMAARSMPVLGGRKAADQGGGPGCPGRCAGGALTGRASGPRGGASKARRDGRSRSYAVAAEREAALAGRVSWRNGVDRWDGLALLARADCM